MTKFKFSLLIVAGLSMTSCNLFNKVSVDTETGQVETNTIGETYSAITEIINGRWEAVTVGDQVVEGDNRPYIVFESTQTNPYLLKAYASNGCNVINGEYSITQKGEIHPVGELISTMMFCPDAKYEIGTTQALNTAAAYSLTKIGKSYELALKNSADSTMMTLRKVDTSNFDGAWKVLSINNHSVKADSEMQFVIDIPSGKIHGNAGCNVLNGSVAIDYAVTNSILFSDLRTTRTTCPDIELEQQLLNALEQTRTAYNDGDRLILKNGEGAIVATLRHIELK